MCYALIGALLAAAVGGQSSAQSQTATTEAQFEVVSIKPNISDSTGGGLRPLPGRIEATNVTLQLLVSYAHGLRGDQVVGGPNWLTSSRYDLTATTKGVTPVDEVRAMMRSLLRERFKLAIHMETQDRPSWVLELARRDGRLGSGLRPCIENCATPRGGLTLGKMSQTGVPISSFVRTLSSLVRGPVVDRTGLSGTFDIDLEWAAESVPPADASTDRVSIFTAVQEQLGLKLESSKGPVEVLVIDSAERPTPD